MSFSFISFWIVFADIDFDPNRLDFINEQLDKIYHLEKKFHVETIAELLNIQATWNLSWTV